MKNKTTYKIAINTRSLIPNRLDGIGWFTYQILNKWVESHPEHQFYFLFDRPYDQRFIFSKNVYPIVVSPPARHPLLWYVWYEWMVPIHLRKINPDVFVSFDTYTSISWKGKKITAIHDIAFALFDGHLDKLSQFFLRHFTPKYINVSDKIITVSESSKNDLIKFYNCDESKIVVSNNAASKIYKPASTEEMQLFKDENTNGCNYFLFVGSIHPRKNILKLLQSFEEYKIRSNKSIKLVLIGRMSWKYHDISQYLNNMKFKNDVICLEHSSPETISKWMSSCISLMMVSFYEGFGVPIVEAYASGVPVICSNVSSMPEVAGDGAILIDPNSVKSIYEAMNTMVEDEEYRNQLILNGLKQVKKYSWENASSIIWNQIEEILS